MRAAFALAIMLVLLGPAQPAFAGSHESIALNAPWKFHTGDNTRWALPSFDDSHWETVDLTAKPGAHDADVGLKNYVPGWSARGHRGYTGYAWYRMTVRVADMGSGTLWLAGPADVDSVYQVYFNGHLVGGIGDFSRDPPLVTSIQPLMFALPRALWTADHGQLRGVLAFRVALVPGASATPPAERGGLHIAPLLGDEDSISDHTQAQWLQTVEGYVVDAAEPVLFLFLAVMALTIMPFDRKDRFYPWLAAALVLLALQRGNQPLFFWGQFETMHEFMFWRLTVVDALLLGAWTMAWREDFKGPRWILPLTATLTGAYAIARLLSIEIFTPWLPHSMAAAFATVLQIVRLGFLGVFLYLAWRCATGTTRGKWSGLVSLVCIAVGLFAQELSDIGVQGIWFPFGVGVSRTQYAYVPLCVALFVHLTTRLWSYASRRVLMP